MQIEGLPLLTGMERTDGTLMVLAQESERDQRTHPHTIVALRTPDGAWEDGGYVDRALVGADVLGDTVYACGVGGTIVAGRGDSWEVVENGLTGEDLWAVRAFQDAVCFAGEFGVLVLRDGSLGLASMVNPEMRTASDLFVGPSGLWSVGATDLVRFDGTDWLPVGST